MQKVNLIESGRHSIMDHQLLFDTCVSKNIFKKDTPEKEKKFLECLVNTNNIKNNNTVIIATPFMLLEYLGCKFEGFEIFNDKSEVNKNIQELLNKAQAAHSSSNTKNYSFDGLFSDMLSAIKSSLEKEHFLQKDSMISKLQAEHKYRSEFGVKIADIYKNILENDFGIDEIINTIAYDRFFAVDIDSSFKEGTQEKKDIWTYFISRVCMLLSQGDENHIPTRMLLRLVNYIKTDQLIKKEAKKHRISIKNIKPNLFTNRELVDTEIVHYSIFGNCAKPEERKPVCIFTSEKLSTWEGRIRYYVDMIKAINPLMIENGFQPLSIYPGKIVEVNQDGMLSGNYINVNNYPIDFWDGVYNIPLNMYLINHFKD